jgi:hypothetical protein
VGVTEVRLLSIAANDPGAAGKIRGSEQAWSAYRDAYIDAMYPAKDKQAACVSTFRMEVDLLRAKLTQQIEALQILKSNFY